jgi:murein L,D-transpeptidase YafK
VSRRGLVLAAVTIGFVVNTDSSKAKSAVEQVDRIFVDKSAHRMTVFAHGRKVRTFAVSLGRGGLAPKRMQGDNRVPEGVYRISGRNPQSAFHLALKIGYPRPDQVAAARKRGVQPGGDIMIHGLPKNAAWLQNGQRKVDWTRGCIAVTNTDMDWLWQAVPDGTAIEIVQ